MKKILLFEDESQHINAIAATLAETGFIVEIVRSITDNIEDTEFQSLLHRAGEFDAIVWDACIGIHLTYIEHIPAFAKVFKGPMIANSEDPGCRRKQTRAGCTHKVPRKDSQILLNELIFALEG